MLPTVRVSGPGRIPYPLPGTGHPVSKTRSEGHIQHRTNSYSQPPFIRPPLGGFNLADRILSFGLRSAPKIFTAVADVVGYGAYTVTEMRYVLHYLDDFLLLGSPGSSEAERALTMATHTFHILGVPVANHKTKGPGTEISFLGILINIDRFQLRLPAQKLPTCATSCHSGGPGACARLSAT